MSSDAKVLSLAKFRQDKDETKATLTEGETPNTLTLLKEVEVFIRRFVVLVENEVLALVLWVMLTYVVEITDCVPYISISSGEKRCGKTRLLEVLEQIVFRPWLTGRTTPAILPRKIDREHPTLLCDELDATFRGDKDFSEALRGILNTGYLRSGKTSLCVIKGKSIDYVDLSTFCMKALAGIGDLPDTVLDRCIPIRLERKLANENVERFRYKNVKEEACRLKVRLQSWAEGFVSVEHPEPMGLDDLPDRAADIWEPLLTIAEAAGQPVAKSALVAAIALCSSKEDESKGVTCLRDILIFFNETGFDRIRSEELVAHLASKEESPWGPSFGKPFNTREMARILKLFKTGFKPIRPQTIRFDDGSTAKGYYRQQLEEAWARYVPGYTIPGKTVTTVTSVTTL